MLQSVNVFVPPFVQRPFCYWEKFPDPLTRQQLISLYNAMQLTFNPNKGFLEADEILDALFPQKMQLLNVEMTSELIQIFKELCFLTNTLEAYYSSIVFVESMLGDKDSSNGKKFIHTLQQLGITAGVRMDKGPVRLAGTLDEFTTEGLDDLAQRLAKVKAEGATFVEWRCNYFINYSAPSLQALLDNSNTLARFAREAQEVGLVPILCPLVSTDGKHNIATAQAVSERVLAFLYKYMADYGVYLECSLLKVNMVREGRNCEEKDKANALVVASSTLTTLKRTVPSAVGGIILRNPTPPEEDGIVLLDFIMRQVPSSLTPWAFTFSSSVLSDNVLNAWKGDDSHINDGQNELELEGRSKVYALLGAFEEMAPQVLKTLNPRLLEAFTRAYKLLGDQAENAAFLPAMMRTQAFKQLVAESIAMEKSSVLGDRGIKKWPATAEGARQFLLETGCTCLLYDTECRCFARKQKEAEAAKAAAAAEAARILAAFNSGTGDVTAALKGETGEVTDAVNAADADGVEKVDEVAYEEAEPS